MKREEKNRKNREHILACALAEFAEQGYQGASVNTVCSRGGISKGQLYYYFTGKDGLYLACVERCFQELTVYLSTHLKVETITPDYYFDVRLEYFEKYPFHQKLFCDCAVNPPQHLREELFSCRAAFDELNETMLTAILEKETLAEGVTLRDAVQQLRIFEELVYIYLKGTGQEAIKTREHNELCRQTFHTMLYGLITRT